MEGFTKFLNIADSLDIMIFQDNNQSLTLHAFVYEVTSDTQIIISNPIYQGAYYPMHRRFEYYFRFYIENVGMFLFKATLIERCEYDHLPSIRVQLISDIKRVQRRKFYRVNFQSEGHFISKKQLSKDEIESQRAKLKRQFSRESDVYIEEEIEERRRFETLDLSGGGLRAVFSEQMDLETPVKGAFKLREDWVEFSGEISRCEKKDDRRYELGIKFLELDSVTQSKIVSYVFEIERNLIKKGLM
ncbi:MAG: hypothetical protein PWQ12_385 [Clostridiales bacterium]|jgi:c-di-GMP-binding flagellar brake protein YcgR|nr:hypothetical protein [Clostridiales bacterium]